MTFDRALNSPVKANTDWRNTLGDERRQSETVFPAQAKSRIDQMSLECMHSHVPLDLMKLLAGKDVMVGVIDVASDCANWKRWRRARSWRRSASPRCDSHQAARPIILAAPSVARRIPRLLHVAKGRGGLPRA